MIKAEEVQKRGKDRNKNKKYLHNTNNIFYCRYKINWKLPLLSLYLYFFLTMSKVDFILSFISWMGFYTVFML
jgi:hypothetical protein